MTDASNIESFDPLTWGEVAPAELEHIVVVSPHFDDAVLGVAHLLGCYPGSTVITVLGGRPPAYPGHVTPWDAQGGFVDGDDVVGARQEEDRAALAVLDAVPVWLDFPDHQYLAPEERPTPQQVAPALEAAITAAGATAVFLPMGLANPDHVLTQRAGRLARERLPGLSWFCYEDAGYKHIPGMLARRVSRLFRSGVWPTPAIVPIVPDMARKRRAIECYASQLPPLVNEHRLWERHAANVPEQYWRLAPPPRGWEAMAEG